MITEAARIRNIHPILSIKGIEGRKYLNAAERGMVSTAAVNAEFGVAIFQNKPKRKITKIPGLINPVNS